MNNNYYMKIALKLAQKAYKRNEVPVGAVIVKNNKIIAKAYNTKHRSNIAINHAEMLAIRKANKKLKDWRLNDSIMYVTLKPCDMCMGAIVESRISCVYYATEKAYSPKNINCIKIDNIELININTNMLKKFFELRR